MESLPAFNQFKPSKLKTKQNKQTKQVESKKQMNKQTKSKIRSINIENKPTVARGKEGKEDGQNG